jgi:hypothetical protein
MRSKQDQRRQNQAKFGSQRNFPIQSGAFPSGIYFARIRVAGKLIRRSLKTDVLSIAKRSLRIWEK